MLEIQNLQKTFARHSAHAVPALQGIDLAIEQGSFVVLIGTNGSGKSTLLNAVAGSFFPDHGIIQLAGKNITRWPEHQRATQIGRVFQNPFSGTAPNMTVAENLALASARGRLKGLGVAVNRRLRQTFTQRVRELNMGLENRLDNPIGTLSGGQRQALTLLMAVWQQPQLLLLDEHTAALDPRSADQVIRLTDDIISRHGLTTMMVTHSMHQAVNLGNRLIMMNRGKIVFDCAGKEKQRLRVSDLLDRFDEIRRMEQLDQSAAAMLRNNYI